MTTVIKWAMAHREMGWEVFDSLDAAVGSAWGCADAGVESIHAIEIIEEDGIRTVLDKDECHARMNAIEERWAAERLEREGPPKPVTFYKVEFRAPPTHDMRYDLTWGRCWFRDRDRAEAEHARMRALLGEDRVKPIEEQTRMA